MRRRIRNIYKTGSLRVWVIVNPPAEPTVYPVNDWKHAKRLIDELAQSQLLDANITDNVFGLEMLDADGEWCEWENEDGDDILAVSDALDEPPKGKG